jgi:hypothetical protein
VPSYGLVGRSVNCFEAAGPGHMRRVLVIVRILGYRVRPSELRRRRLPWPCLPPRTLRLACRPSGFGYPDWRANQSCQPGVA